MKRWLLALPLLSALCTARGQTVENIRVETGEDRILIHYRIGQSTGQQFYHVTLTCSMDGGSRFEPASVTGDVGQYIPGGKTNYTITWYVFEDLDEVGNVEFFIRVEEASQLQEDARGEALTAPGPFNENIPVREQFEQSTFIGFNGSTYSPFGISGGSLKRTGFFGSARAGTNNDEYQNDIWLTLVGGFTMNAFSKGIYRMHPYAGIGTSIEHYEELETGDSWTEPMIAVEGGLMHAVGRIALTAGAVYVGGYGLHFVYGVAFLF